MSVAQKTRGLAAPYTLDAVALHVTVQPYVFRFTRREVEDITQAAERVEAG